MNTQWTVCNHAAEQNVAGTRSRHNDRVARSPFDTTSRILAPFAPSIRLEPIPHSWARLTGTGVPLDVETSSPRDSDRRALPRHPLGRLRRLPRGRVPAWLVRT